MRSKIQKQRGQNVSSIVSPKLRGEIAQGISKVVLLSEFIDLSLPCEMGCTKGSNHLSDQGRRGSWLSLLFYLV